MTCKSIITTSHSFLNARISPKENRGANGKFLPNLFHLRHSNSETIGAYASVLSRHTRGACDRGTGKIALWRDFIECVGRDLNATRSVPRLARLFVKTLQARLNRASNPSQKRPRASSYSQLEDSLCVGRDLNPRSP